MKTLLVVFWEKNSFGAISSFYLLGHFLLLDWAWSNWARPLLIGSFNSQDMISFMITTGSFNNQDMTRILKQWRHDFTGKHLRDRYCMDIMWCLFEDQWFCKASLWICFVSLFECKGLWMLKTVIKCVEQKITKLDWKSTMSSVVKFLSYFFV